LAEFLVPQRSRRGCAWSFGESNMLRWKSFAVAVLLMVVAVAGYCVYAAARTASLSDEEWDICEAVLRHQIFHSSAAGRGTATVYVEVQGDNPTGAFIDRFQGHQPPVRPGWWYFHSSGVLYRIGAIKRTGENSAEVSGGYYEGSLSASGNTYYVVRKDGKWVVERDQMNWISLLSAEPVVAADVTMNVKLRL
jgi:hypothetical protein